MGQSRRSYRRFTAMALLGAAALLLIAACAGDDSDPTPTEPVGESPASTSSVEPAGSGQSDTAETPTARPNAAEPTATPEIGPDGWYTEVQVNSAGTKHIIPWNRVANGGPAKDGIPSIDQPQFATSESWDELEYRPTALVIGVEVDGVRRAYPFQVLVWHELVNDTINGKPILISYCPLCGTAIAFERLVNGEEIEFGVSGLLYNSDLLMYDRATDGLWSQLTGHAVAGELTSVRLEFYPSEIMSWEDWRASYPDSEVLTRETGHARDYDREPYGDYYFDDSLLFPVNSTGELFDVLRLKDDVTGVEVDGPAYGAFLDEDVREAGIANELVGDTLVVVFADPTAGGNIVVFERGLGERELTFLMDEAELIDEQTGTSWSFDGLALEGELAGSQLEAIIPVKGFWFSWVAFHPETTLWMLPEE